MNGYIDVYINNQVKFGIELMEWSNKFENHFNRFRKASEIPDKRVLTDDERAIGRYDPIPMNAMALVDFYSCGDKSLDQKKYLTLQAPARSIGPFSCNKKAIFMN